MRKIVILTTALLLSASPAFSADLYIPEVPVVEAMGGYDWSGFYVGASVGGMRVDIATSGPGFVQPGGTGLLAGGFAGYNMQYDQFVVGLEADIYYSTFEASAPCGNPAFTCSSNIDLQGSARARVGYAADAVLFYLTGGIAAARFDGATNNGTNFPDSRTLIGYTVGAGVEIGLTEELSARAEYRYTNYAASDFLYDVAYPGIDVDSHAVTFGLAYRF